MIAYYQLIERLHAHLIADADINTVEIGDLDIVDLPKQTIYPIGHILVQNVEFQEGVVRFTVVINTFDMVDVTKKDIRAENEPFKGIDNKQDVLNTMLAVLENLDKSLLQGAFLELGWELQGNLTAEPFEERLENLLTGWSGTFIIDTPNTVQDCT